MLRGAGIPLLENSKVTKFPFHGFDRYAIRIQDFEDVLRGSSSSSGADFFEISKCKQNTNVKCNL